MRRIRKNNDEFAGCMAQVLMVIIAMPVVGIYLFLKGDNDNDKALGAALTFFGIIIWILMWIWSR